MTETRWTPGPWILYEEPYQHHRVKRMIRSNTGQIAHVLNSSVPTIRVAEANAHLIAAAPELYAALERLLNITDMGAALDQPGSATEQARAILTKARGETE